MEEFLYNIRMINNVLGHKVLEPLVVEEESDNANSESQIHYIQAARGADAKGMQTNEGFVAIKGSRIADSVTKSCPKSICDLRNKLIKNGVVDENWFLRRIRYSAAPLRQ